MLSLIYSSLAQFEFTLLSTPQIPSIFAAMQSDIFEDRFLGIGKSSPSNCFPGPIPANQTENFVSTVGYACHIFLFSNS